jgi:hypothetical protein
MAPSNNTAVFYSGSIDFNNINYRGFVATQTTVVEAVAWGSNGVSGSLTPNMTIAAGTEIPVWFSAFKGTGSIVAYK